MSPICIMSSISRYTKRFVKVRLSHWQESILGIHLNRMKLGQDIDLKNIHSAARRGFLLQRGILRVVAHKPPQLHNKLVRT